MRMDLLKHGNELEACNERLFTLEDTKRRLKEEKDILERELKR